MLAATGALTLAVGLAPAGPHRARTLDLAGSLMLVSLVPLAVLVAGLPDLVAALVDRLVADGTGGS